MAAENTRLDRLSIENDVERLNTNFTLCLICQNNTSEDLVKRPKSYKPVVDAIAERAKYGELLFAEKWMRLERYTYAEIEENNGTWHRSCYKDTVHSGMIERARRSYLEAIKQPVHNVQNYQQPFLRSMTEPRQNKTKTCFFVTEKTLERNFIKSPSIRKK